MKYIKKSRILRDFLIVRERSFPGRSNAIWINARFFRIDPYNSHENMDKYPQKCILSISRQLAPAAFAATDYSRLRMIIPFFQLRVPRKLSLFVCNNTFAATDYSRLRMIIPFFQLRVPQTPLASRTCPKQQRTE